jgi:hypothetical protein
METWIIILGIFLIVLFVNSIGGSMDTTEVLAKKLLVQKFKDYGFNVSDFPSEFLDELTQKIVKEAELTSKLYKNLQENIIDNIDVYVTHIAMELDGKGEGNLSEEDPFNILNILKKHDLV